MPPIASIVTLDQEQGAIVDVINGVRAWSRTRPVADGSARASATSSLGLFDPETDLEALLGDGLVIADGTAWSIRNDLPVSQYCWENAMACHAEHALEF